jgi:DNA-binding NtrC family response regulator
MAATDDQHHNQPDDNEATEALSSDRTWLEVAILASASESAAPDERAVRDPALVAATVLIVARDADMRAYIRDCLSATGLRLLEARELASAPTTTGVNQPDLLIIDLSGQERSAARNDADPLTPSLYARAPRLLITDEPHAAGDLSSETAALLPRPFNARRLQLEVMRCLSGRRRE